MRHEKPVLAGVAGHQRIVIDDVMHLPEDARRHDRDVVRGIGRMREEIFRRAGLVERLLAGRHRIGGGCTGRFDRIGDLRQHLRRVADDDRIAREGPARVLRLDVDLYDGLPARVDKGRVLVDRIGRTQAGADGQHQISAADIGIRRRLPEITAGAKRPLMGLRNDALARCRGGHRCSDQSRQSRQLVIGLTDPHAVAGDNDRPFRRRERPCGGRDTGRVARQCGRQVRRRIIENRTGIRIDRPAGEAVAVEHDTDRAALAAERVLDAELHRMHGLRRRQGGQGMLGDRA